MYVILQLVERQQSRDITIVDDTTFQHNIRLRIP